MAASTACMLAMCVLPPPLSPCRWSVIPGDTILFDFVYFIHPTAIGHWWGAGRGEWGGCEGMAVGHKLGLGSGLGWSILEEG